MIEVKLFANSKDEICAFEIKNHGQAIVCAAVSALAINTVNSIEAFCPESCEYEHAENGGYLFFELSDKENMSEGAALLLKSLKLGLMSIRENYGTGIAISVEQTDGCSIKRGK